MSLLSETYRRNLSEQTQVDGFRSESCNWDTGVSDAGPLVRRREHQKRKCGVAANDFDRVLEISWPTILNSSLYLIGNTLSRHTYAHFSYASIEEEKTVQATVSFSSPHFSGSLTLSYLSYFNHFALYHLHRHSRWQNLTALILWENYHTINLLPSANTLSPHSPPFGDAR